MDIKQEAINRLKGKTPKYFYREYCKAENNLMNSIEHLNNYGKECGCDGCDDSFKIIHNGRYEEIIEYCLSCGGIVSNGVYE